MSADRPFQVGVTTPKLVDERLRPGLQQLVMLATHTLGTGAVAGLVRLRDT